MPSVNRHQHAFMAMSRTPFGRAALEKHGHTPAPLEVAEEFMSADKGRHFPDFPAYGHHPGDYKGEAK